MRRRFQSLELLLLLLTFLALLFTDRLTAMGRRDTSCISNVAQANNRHLYSVSGPYFTFSFHFSDMYVREVWLVTVVNQNARRQMILTIHQSERKCVINLCHHQCLIQSALFINFSFFFRVRKRKKTKHGRTTGRISTTPSQKKILLLLLLFVCFVLESFLFGFAV